MKKKGILEVVLASVFIGFSYVFSSQGNKVVDPITFTMLASLLSSVIFFFVMKVTKKNLYIRKSLRENPKEVAQIVLLRSILGSVIVNFGMRFTNATRAVFISRLEPVFVLLLGYAFLKEKISPKQIILIFGLILGAFLISTGGDIGVFTTYSLGDLLVALSLLFFSYSYFPSEKLMKKALPQTITIVTNFFAGIILLIFVLIAQPNTLLIGNWGLFLILGKVFTFFIIGLSLWYAALRTIKPWIVSSLLSLTPIFGGILAYLWLGEILNSIQFIGGIIIIFASYLISKGKDTF